MHSLAGADMHKRASLRDIMPTSLKVPGQPRYHVCKTHILDQSSPERNQHFTSKAIEIKNDH